MTARGDNLSTGDSRWGPKFSNLEALVEANPYDTASWNLLLSQAQMCRIEEARPIYESFFQTFPFSGRYLSHYVQHEMKYKNYDRAEEIFKTNLRECLNVEFWKSYLNYIVVSKRPTGRLQEQTLEIRLEYRNVVTKAYEFVLSHIGMDINSSSIWRDYVDFLKSNWDTAGNAFEEGKKMEAIRNVYQRAIVIPMYNLENFWKEYNSYENSLNKITARKILEEKSSGYMNARTVFRERKAHTEDIVYHYLPVPLSNSVEERQQIKFWKKYISWEASNPSKLEKNDLINRVVFAYKQSLLNLRYIPEIWIQYSRYLIENEMIKQAEEVFEEGVKTIPNSLMFKFFFAEFQESRGNLEKCHEIYNSLISESSSPPVPPLEASSTNDSPSSAPLPLSPSPSTPHDLISPIPSLVYIQYLKFARRSLGPQEARKVFSKAHKDARTTYHVFVAHALMEHHHSKNIKVSLNIFEQGLKGLRSFYSEPEYVKAYVQYLIDVNELNNVRVLFERVLEMIEDKKLSFNIWKYYYEFENTFGTLAQRVSIETRWQAAFQYEGGINLASMDHLVNQFRYNNLFPCNSQELRSYGINPREYSGVVSFLNPPPLENDSLRSLRDFPSGEDEHLLKNFVKPDLGHYIPFKVQPYVDICADSTSTFKGMLVPESIAAVMRLLPPSQCFQGPFVIIDDLLVAIKQMILPNIIPKKRKLGGSAEGSNASGHPATEGESRPASKRHHPLESEDPADPASDESHIKAPAQDIYRLRQSKRIQQLQDT